MRWYTILEAAFTRKRHRNSSHGFGAMVLLLMLLFLPLTSALANDQLAERFSDVPQIEWHGKTYFLRSRLTPILLVGLINNNIGDADAEFIMLATIDDNDKAITPIIIDSRILVEIDGASFPLQKVFAGAAEPEEGMNSMVEAINGLLGVELIYQYVSIDLTSISALPEFHDITGDARTRLHFLRETLEHIPSEERNALYNAVSAYLITDMKSGDVMRAVDKAERYEIADEIALPLQPLQDGGAPLPDEAAIRELLIELFFDDKLF